MRYIHRNALDLPGVSRAKDYRWSSHRTYLGLRREPEWMCTSTILDGWAPATFDRFVDEPLGPLVRATEPDVPRLIGAIELVLAERGVCAERRLGAVARQIALAHLADTQEMPEGWLMSAFDMARLGTLRTAASRARALLRSEPEFREAQSRAVDLLTDALITSRV